MTRLTEIKARVAQLNAGVPGFCYHGQLLSDLEYALGEIERLHDISAFNGLTEQVKALSAERDRLRAALKGISKLGNLTLLGGSAMDSERAHEAGAHEAFSQAADIARSALGADYVQEG